MQGRAGLKEKRSPYKFGVDKATSDVINLSVIRKNTPIQNDKNYPAIQTDERPRD